MELAVEDITPRAPRQARSRETVRQILVESARLLQESGAASFSMPTVAVRAKVNRASVYKYFPTKFAIFNALAQKYVEVFIARVSDHLAQTTLATWQDATKALIRFTADVYNDDASARVLFLSGALTPEIDAAHHVDTNQRVARFTRQLFEERYGVKHAPADPDPYLAAIEAVIALFAIAQRKHARIGSDYIAEGYTLAKVYLETHLAPDR